jgi:lysophospholipase L1-like esterase
LSLPKRIHIFGASGSGTTTLASALSKKHGHHHFDADDFYWLPTDPPYQQKRTPSDRQRLLARLKERNIKVVLLGYPGAGGREIAQQFSALWYGQPNKNISPDMIQADGQHFTKEGYAVLAKNMSLLITDIVNQPAK